MFNVALKLELVDLNYIFECDWLIELSDNNLCNKKLADNLASEQVENGSFLFEPIAIEKIAIFTISNDIVVFIVKKDT